MAFSSSFRLCTMSGTVHSLLSPVRGLIRTAVKPKSPSWLPFKRLKDAPGHYTHPKRLEEALVDLQIGIECLNFQLPAREALEAVRQMRPLQPDHLRDCLTWCSMARAFLKRAGRKRRQCRNNASPWQAHPCLITRG